MLGRRAFLSLLGMTPIAAKALRDEAAAKLSGVAHPRNWSDSGVAMPSSDSAIIQRKQVLSACANPAARQKLLDAIWEDERHVGAIDPDIAVMRSLSLNAKITFQRQRNVQRRYEKLTAGYAYERLQSVIDTITKPFTLS